MKRAHGFTIVELLIVIVVIAILVAISIVAYSNISQKANNAAIIKAAGDTVKLLQAYTVERGVYPVGTTATRCVLSQSGCMNSAGATIAGDSAIVSSVAGIGSLPSSVPFSGDNRNGIFYQYVSSRTVDGVSQPLMITYWMQGVDQQCGLSGAVASNESGKTRCNVTVPGPAHS